MKSQINILRQLQELVLTRDEHHQTGDGSHLDALNDSIAALQQKLNPQVTGLYDRLYKKNHIVISAMTNNCCAVCGMQVPIAQGSRSASRSTSSRARAAGASCSRPTKTPRATSPRRPTMTIRRRASPASAPRS